MAKYTIDSNVLILANGRDVDASISCQMAAIIFLNEIISDGSIILLDSIYHIFDEYKRYLNMSGQPGVGDKFMKWLHTNIANPNFIEIVEVSYDETSDKYSPYPENGELNGFDRSDRKFVAVSLAVQNSCEIVNCVDSDWEQFGAQFRGIGVRIKQLCQ